MKIELKLFASLARHVPGISAGKSLVIEINESSTVKEVIELMEIPIEEVKLIFLNGVISDMKSILKEGDRLGVFPLIAGG